MQNKGAIRLFAILLALACAYYLMFTYVGTGIESQAKKYSEEFMTQPDVLKEVKDAALAMNDSIVDPAKKASLVTKDSATYFETLKNVRKTYYLDSLKKLSVIDFGPLKYTYEEVRDR